MPTARAKKKKKPAKSPATDLAAAMAMVEKYPAEYRTINLDELQLYTANPKKHDEADLAETRAALKEFGQVSPLLVQKSTMTVIDGNGRLTVMRELGWTNALCRIIDCDDATVAALSVTLGRTQQLAGWDPVALEASLRIMQTGNEELAASWAKLAESQGIIPADAKMNGQPPADEAEELDSGDEPEDALDLLFKAPFPWFGGKSRIARMAWRHFGDVQNFIEPFFGSGAVLLNRPPPFSGTETVNDADGLVCNFWRAVKSDPDKVAEFADWPVNECCPAGTMIRTPNGDVPIEHVRHGMIVWGWDGDKTVLTRVTATNKSVASDFIQVGPLRVTPNHPVWTKEVSYRPAGDLSGHETLAYCPAEYDCVYNGRDEHEKTLGYLRPHRSTDGRSPLCWRELSGPSTLSGAFKSSKEGVQEACLLLDSFADETGASADLPSIGEWSRRTRLARRRNALDYYPETQRETLQSHQRRRWNSRIRAHARIACAMEQATQGKEVSARTHSPNAWQVPFPGSAPENQSGRERAEPLARNAGAHVSGSETTGDFPRTTGSHGRCQFIGAADRGIPAAVARGAQHTSAFVRGDRYGLFVDTASSGRYRCKQRCSSIRLARAKGLQRIHFSTPVAVYNFQTETGNYFAEGVLVHNCDLHARHAWLVSQKDSLQAKLEGDPDLFDAKVAGWWVWGMACWIGSGFCSGTGPWQIVEAEDGSRQLVHLGNAGRGVNRQRVHLGDAGRGVNRQLVHLGNAGRGVNRQRVHLSAPNGQGVRVVKNIEGGKAGIGERGLLEWMRALSERLQRVRVCCGDWTRVCGGNSGNALKHFFASGQTCAVFLDPPYADTADRTSDLYRKDSESVAHAVRKWAIDHGDDQRLRICLAGYEGEHKMPKSWKCVAWKAHGGYSCVAENSKAQENAHKERCWFSPHCVSLESP